MLTKEQIKNLKPGDPIIIHGTFVKTHYDGDIQYESPYTGPDDKISNTYRSTIPSCVSLPESQTVEITLTPTPKYDPCRKFRKGDVVDVISAGRGRTAFLYLEEDETHGDGHWVVTADEDVSGRVNICYNGERCARVWYNMLELVTPVEELEPYRVGESTDYFSVDDREGEELSIYWKDKHPNAKEAAEADCARLNAEYRKENQQ